MHHGGAGGGGRKRLRVLAGGGGGQKKLSFIIEGVQKVPNVPFPHLPVPFPLPINNEHSLSHFWKSVIFAIPTKSLSIYASTLAIL